jgi:hypothetical protein
MHSRTRDLLAHKHIICDARCNFTDKERGPEQMSIV